MGDEAGFLISTWRNLERDDDDGIEDDGGYELEKSNSFSSVDGEALASHRRLVDHGKERSIGGIIESGERKCTELCQLAAGQYFERLQALILVERPRVSNIGCASDLCFDSPCPDSDVTDMF